MAALLKLDLPFFLVLEGLTHGFWHWKAAPEKVSPINGSNPGLFLLVTPAGCSGEADCLAMVFWHILCAGKKKISQLSPQHRQGAAWDGAVHALGQGDGFSRWWCVLMRSQQAGEPWGTIPLSLSGVTEHPHLIWAVPAVLGPSPGTLSTRVVQAVPSWARCPHPVPASRHAGARGRPGWCSWMWRELMEHRPEAALISTEARGGGSMPGDCCRLSPARERCRESIQAPGRASRRWRCHRAPPGKRLHPQYGGRALRHGCSAPGAAGMARRLSAPQGGISAEPPEKGLVLGWEIKGPKQCGEITLFSPSFCFFSFGSSEGVSWTKPRWGSTRAGT